MRLSRGTATIPKWQKIQGICAPRSDILITNNNEQPKSSYFKLSATINRRWALVTALHAAVTATVATVVATVVAAVVLCSRFSCCG